jgi:hypothetical protein
MTYLLFSVCEVQSWEKASIVLIPVQQDKLCKYGTKGPM